MCRSSTRRNARTAPSDAMTSSGTKMPTNIGARQARRFALNGAPSRTCARTLPKPTPSSIVQASTLAPSINRCLAHPVPLCYLRHGVLICFPQYPDNLLVAIPTPLHLRSLAEELLSLDCFGLKIPGQVRTPVRSIETYGTSSNYQWYPEKSFSATCLLVG